MQIFLFFNTVLQWHLTDYSYLYAAPEHEWNKLLLNGLTIGKGKVAPEELYAVINKRMERTLIRTVSTPLDLWPFPVSKNSFSWDYVFAFFLFFTLAYIRKEVLTNSVFLLNILKAFNQDQRRLFKYFRARHNSSFSSQLNLEMRIKGSYTAQIYMRGHNGRKNFSISQKVETKSSSENKVLIIIMDHYYKKQLPNLYMFFF